MTDSIRARLGEIHCEMQALEMRDDRLFTNGNGNLPEWQALRSEYIKLKGELSDVT